MKIESVFSDASQKASNIKNATNRLSQVSKPSLDNRTTVAGNSKAHQAISDANDSIKQLIKAVNSASSNLQSVAKEFQAKDEEIAQQLFKEDRWRP